MTIRKYFYDRGWGPAWVVPGDGRYDPARDTRPLLPRNGPKPRKILIMDEAGGVCSSCSQRVLPGVEYYLTPKGSVRHAECGLQG